MKQNMMLSNFKPKLNPLTIVLISLAIVTSTFFPLFYFQETIQASICTFENVSSDVWIEGNTFQAVCSAERTLNYLFNISGGLFIGIFSLMFAWLSYSKRWRIGMICSLSIAASQFCMAVLETYTVFYNHHDPYFYVFTILITAIVFSFASDFFAKKQYYKNSSRWFWPIVSLLVMGTIIFSFVMTFWFPDEQTALKYAIISISGCTIISLIKINHDNTKFNKINKTHNSFVMIS